MWVWAAVLSAALLGIYEVAKKRASTENGVLHVLLYATALGALFFLPLILSSIFGWGIAEGTVFSLEKGTLEDHLLILTKSLIVTVSWILGLYALKNLPITTAGTIKASRPVFVLLGSILIFGERLNVWQWVGVVIAIVALFLLSVSSKKEGVDFAHNKWIVCMFGSVLSGVISALIDKKIMAWMSPIFVQSWCNFYIAIMMAVIVIVCRFSKSRLYEHFHWDWTILWIAVFLTCSDFLYFYSLQDGSAMISVVSLLRRCSVIVTFIAGAILFKEHNLKSKALELLLLLAGAAILVFGSC
ncbi:MAG: DMT family transporter [Bacteroidales bacterium]|nr:DMT family transporter [Candidatus Cacconaster merdequi]